MRKFSKNLSSINKKRLYDPENPIASRDFYVHKTDRGGIYLNLQKMREKEKYYKNEDFNNVFCKKYYSYDIEIGKSIASNYFCVLRKFKSRKQMLKFWRKYLTAQRNSERRRNTKIKAAECKRSGGASRPDAKARPKKSATSDRKYHIVCVQSDMDEEN